MSTLTLGIVVIIYMFILAWLGYIGYKQTKNASDYLLGGRKVNPVIMALSYGATFISASAIVGFGGIHSSPFPLHTDNLSVKMSFCLFGIVFVTEHCVNNYSYRKQ